MNVGISDIVSKPVKDVGQMAIWMSNLSYSHGQLLLYFGEG